eukprot:TRINITY_DN60674_c0_g1_i1.p1 TRINITY_DN60674_c0_g1~~TRINITY_DN60674_c0_g1_i1.p1  ORF type:complete len:315 (+),score=114.33 TRINITY_DN60674_c0_g1_i1:121-1065(+)
MSQINQYEDFQSVGHVVYLLGEFIVVNAAFSFATDMVTQKLEGKWFCCRPAGAEETEPVRSKPPTPSASAAAEGKPAPEVPPTDPSPSAGPGDVASAPGPGAPKLVAVIVTTERWDVSRSTRFAATGVFFCGVVQFLRLGVINVVFDRGDHSFKTAIWKTVVNQAVFSPIVRAWSMMTVRYMYERSHGHSPGESWAGACKNLREKFIEAQGVSYLVKPVSNVLAFAFFPSHILGQAIVMRTVAFVYNVYFDFLVHVEQAQEEKAKLEGGEELPKEDAEKADEGDGEKEGAGEAQAAKQKKEKDRICCCESCCVM